MDLKSAAPRAFQLLFLTSISHWFSGVNRDRPRSHIAAAPSTSVRAAAYRQCGGYEALRLTVLDDVKLGQLLVRAGKRTRAFLGVTTCNVTGAPPSGACVKLLEKNNFAALDFRLGLALALSGVRDSYFRRNRPRVAGRDRGWAHAALLPVDADSAGEHSGAASGLAVALRGFSCRSWCPCSLSMVNSTWVTLRQGGIRWRDTFYSLETLRTGTVR